MKGSTHNHSTGSDGKLTPEEVIKKAIELGWNYIYFTDHYILPPGFPLKKKKFFDEKYIEEIKQLKEKYKDKIEVCFGVELNWLPEYFEWLKTESKKDFDYIIGALHFLFEKDGNFRFMENGENYWLESADKFGGTQGYVQEYYKQIKNLVKSGFFDSVAHLDYIRIYNKDNYLFDENSDWYKKEISEVLDLIKENKMALEINHGGIRKCGEQFPRLWIIKEAKKRNIPITLGLDAHHAEHLSNEAMNQLIQIAKQAGYSSVIRFEKRKMIEEKL